MPVIGDRHGELGRIESEVDGDSLCAGVLGGVGERLGDNEIRAPLQRGRKPLDLERRRDLHLGVVACGQRAHRRDQAAVREQWRRDPAGEVAQIRDRAGGFAPGVLDQPLGPRPTLQRQLGAAELDRKRDQPRLRAVMDVALDPAQLGGLRVHRLPA